jgi:hypothetical protein
MVLLIPPGPPVQDPKEQPVSGTTSTEAVSTGTSNTERPAHRGRFVTLQEAQAVKPASDKQRIFEVSKGGSGLGFTWASSVNEAIVAVARLDRYTARVAEPKDGGPLTKERVASKLAEFTDEELAAMGLTRKKGKK